MKKEVSIQIPAQSIKFEIDIPDGPVIVPPVVVDPPVISEGFKIGTNGFPWFPLSLLQGIGVKWMRCYFASGWGWQPGGLAMQPLHQAETVETEGMDDLLIRAKAMGIEVLWCNHQTPEWYRPTGRGDGNNDYAPCRAGAKRDDPESYKDYAEYLAQVAMRYGAVNYPDSALRVDTTPRWPGDKINVKKSGLHLLKYIEVWNEEKWWKKGTTENEAYIEPEAMAALMSKCYGEIKRADPSMVVVMPGLTDYDFPYIAKMDAWFIANRPDKKWACDVAQLHHYNNKGNKPKQHPAQWVNDGACLPKDDANFVTIREVVDFFASRGLKTWLGETGADKKSPSQVHAKGIGMTDEQFQAQIIIESIKAYKAAGVDAVFIFTGPDDIGAADGGQFETSGIFSSQATGYKPTPASAALKAYISESTPRIARVASAGEMRPPIKASEFKRPMK